MKNPSMKTDGVISASDRLYVLTRNNEWSGGMWVGPGARPTQKTPPEGQPPFHYADIWYRGCPVIWENYNQDYILIPGSKHWVQIRKLRHEFPDE